MKVESLPIINLPDISIRQLEKTNIEEWFAYLSIPYVVKETSWNLKSVRDLEKLFDTIETTSKDSPIRFAIMDTKHEKLARTIGFHTISDINKTAEIAYDLSPNYWNLGIATSVCRTVTEWGVQRQRVG